MSVLPKKIALLGATGSIGSQTLAVVERLGFGVSALTAYRNTAQMEALIRRFRPRFAAMGDPAAAAELRLRVRDTDTTVAGGPEGVAATAACAQSDLVLNAIVGVAGLLPTLACIEAGKPLALANKETLVAGGDLVMGAIREKGLPLLPVDSEHSAIFQCLQGQQAAVEKIILTASGGPFLGKTRQELAAVTPAEAVRHPNWSMGAKITVDSATLMNKGFEVIEACHLFGVAPSQVEVLVHPQSIVHSLVEFCDGAQLAQLGMPDMRVPIQYALTYPVRAAADFPRLDLAAAGQLTFSRPDADTFPALGLCIRALQAGGLYPCAVNAANEEAVAAFLAGKIGFLQIPSLVEKSAFAEALAGPYGLTELLETDQAVRRRMADMLSSHLEEALV